LIVFAVASIDTVKHILLTLSRAIERNLGDTLLTDAELTSMRATASQALPGTAVIQSQSFASDGGGGGSLTWAAGGTVDCRLAPLGGTEREIADRISSDADYIVTLPYDASVTTNSRLIINGGGTFNVEAIRDRSWHTSTRVEVVRQT
jgi:head-tail adaptor